MTKVYIGLGSNLNNREMMLSIATEKLGNSGEINVIKRSTSHETKPVGGPSQPDFLNAALEIDTSLQPEELLARLQEIENDLGREREIKWGPRTIDMDILLCGNSIINNVDLQIPHPLMHLRRFVLAPLSEIAPYIKHPIFNKTIVELRDELETHSQ